MHRDTARELAANTVVVGYHEWLEIPGGLLYHTCADCGLSNSLMVDLPNPDRVPATELRVRILYEPELTNAARESEKIDHPLHSELKRLREENLNLRKTNLKLHKTLLDIKSCFNIGAERLLAPPTYVWGLINLAIGETNELPSGPAHECGEAQRSADDRSSTT